MNDLSRRRILFGGAALGAGALLTACTSNDAQPRTPRSSTDNAEANPNAAPGKKVIIGFSAPAADHGWVAAITNNAKAQAAAYSDVEFRSVEAGADAAAQRAALSTLIAQKPNVIVLLPHDGKELNAVGLEAMQAGIPVVNLDRAFPDAGRLPAADQGRQLRHGRGRRHLHRRAAEGQGRRQPDHRRDPRHRLAGADPGALGRLQRGPGRRTASRSPTGGPAEFTADTGQRAATELLQALPKMDALWNHDDDQGIGVLAAANQANRKEFFMVGGAGSKAAIDAIAADNTVLKATVTYSPSMASSAISLARLIGQGKGMSDLVELQVPKEITLASETITKENARKYAKLGF